MALERLLGSSYYLRGSPATLLFIDDRRAFVIDPGHGVKRGKILRKEFSKIDVDRPIVILTHFHSDHLNLLAEGKFKYERVVVSELDAPGVEFPIYRVMMTFGIPMMGDDSLLLYEPKSVRVDEKIAFFDGYYGDLGIFTLPGHTPGHIGVLTPDGVFYAGDLVFGDRVLNRYPVPYHLDACQSYESMLKLLDLVSSKNIRVLVPGHGPVIRGEDDIRSFVKMNMESIDRFKHWVLEFLERGPLTIEDIAGLFVAGKDLSPGLYLLAVNSLRGVLACLVRNRLVEAFVEEDKLLWGLR